MSGWVEVIEDDILRPEFRPDEIRTSPIPRTSPPFSLKDQVNDLFAMFENDSIGGIVHTSLRALIERWGVSGAEVIELLALSGGTSWVDVRIRWSDRAVRITRLALGPTRGVFGYDPWHMT